MLIDAHSHLDKYLLKRFGMLVVSKTDFIKKLIMKTDIFGEIGLDHYYVKDKYRYATQKKIFNLFLSNGKNKILSFHTKGAERNALSLLRKYETRNYILINLKIFSNETFH